MSLHKYIHTGMIAALLIMSSFVAAAQSGLMYGTITDAESGEPIDGASVVWVNENNKILEGAITDRKGYYMLEDIGGGEQKIVIKHIGYKSRQEVMTFDVQETKKLDFMLEPTEMSISPVEIIGKSDKNKMDLVGTATQIETKTIELINPVGTQELLTMVPGVHGFADDGAGNSRLSIGIRGLNPRRSSRVLVLEDGIPIQPAVYIYPNMYYNPPVERIDEVEVIKGSAGIKYGPQTMGGVINYITKKPKDELGGELQLTAGLHKYASGFLKFGGWGSEKAIPELQLLYKRGDGYRDNNSFEQYNSTFKLNLKPSEKANVYIKANANYENSNATYTGLTEYAFDSDPEFNPKEDDNFEVFRTSLDIIYQKQAKDNLLSTTKAFGSYFKRDWWRETDIFVRPSDYFDEDENLTPVPYYVQGDLIRTGNNRDNFGVLRTFYVLGVEHSYDFDHFLRHQKGKLKTGARIYWERFLDDKQTGFAPDAHEGFYYVTKGIDPEWDKWHRWDPANNTDSIAVLGQSHHYETMALSYFTEEEIVIDEKLTIVPGFRVEWFEQERIDRIAANRYQDKTTIVFLPGLGLNYQLGKTNLFAGIHRGFTPPSSGTLKVVNFGANVTTGGLDLEAEKSWNSELGARGRYNWLSYEIAAFHLYIQDMVAAGRGTVFENLGKVQTYGLENSLYFSLSGLKGSGKYLPDFYVNYTYLQTEILDAVVVSSQQPGQVDISGNELPYAPHHKFTAGVRKEFGFKLTLDVNLEYTGEVFTDFENIRFTDNRGDQGPVPAYYLLNANASYKLKDNWTFFASAKNVLDNIYIGSRLHSNPGQPQANLSSGILVGPRRQINIGIKYTFIKTKKEENESY